METEEANNNDSIPVDLDSLITFNSNKLPLSTVSSTLHQVKTREVRLRRQGLVVVTKEGKMRVCQETLSMHLLKK